MRVAAGAGGGATGGGGVSAGACAAGAGAASAGLLALPQDLDLVALVAALDDRWYRRRGRARIPRRFRYNTTGQPPIVPPR